MRVRWYIGYIREITHRAFGRIAWWLNERKLRACRADWGDLKLETDVGKWLKDFLGDKVCRIRTVEDLFYVLLRELNMNFLWLWLFGKRLEDHKVKREDVAFEISKVLNRFLEMVADRGIIEKGSAWWTPERVKVFLTYRNWWIREIAIYIDITNEGLRPYLSYICHDNGVRFAKGVGAFC